MKLTAYEILLTRLPGKIENMVTLVIYVIFYVVISHDFTRRVKFWLGRGLKCGKGCLERLFLEVSLQF